jgi:hypothetical protein
MRISIDDGVGKRRGGAAIAISLSASADSFLFRTSSSVAFRRFYNEINPDLIYVFFLILEIFCCVSRCVDTVAVYMRICSSLLTSLCDSIEISQYYLSCASLFAIAPTTK